jgi:hypothetical protein
MQQVSGIRICSLVLMLAFAGFACADAQGEKGHTAAGQAIVAGEETEAS